MYLEELIENVELESDKFECKSRLNREDVVGWLKSIAGFANASGGDFYIGVEDKTNKLIGFDRTEADNERNYFNNQVNEHLSPRPQMKLSFLRYMIKEKERFIIQVHIPESAVKPVILKYKNIPSIFMRRDGFTNGATYEEIIEMSVRSKNTQYDILTSDELYRAENFTMLQEFYASHNNGRKLSEKALQSMGFYDKDGMLANGAVLFADDYQGKKTEVQCSVFSGFNKGSERIITINRFHGNIIAVLNYMMEFVEQRMNHSMIKLDDTRENIDAYPKRALFEGVINAIAHRDYFLDGTQIQAGTGFDKITEEYQHADETHRPYIYASSDHFTLVLPDLTYMEGIENSGMPNLVFTPVPHGTVYDAKILSFCYYQAHKVSEIAEYLGVSDSTYFRKQVLENLAENQYLYNKNI